MAMDHPCGFSTAMQASVGKWMSCKVRVEASARVKEKLDLIILALTKGISVFVGEGLHGLVMVKFQMSLVVASKS